MHLCLRMSSSFLLHDVQLFPIRKGNVPNTSRNHNTVPTSPCSNEEFIIPLDARRSTFYKLFNEIYLHPFNSDYAKRLKRSNARLVVLSPQWQHHQNFGDLLQAHLASISRCMVIVRLCLAALWVLYDISTILENDSLVDRTPMSRESVNTPELSYKLDVRFIWEGSEWKSVEGLIGLADERKDLGPRQQFALQYLWCDLLAIFLLIYSIGLPFGLPPTFQSNLREALDTLGQSNLLFQVKSTDSSDGATQLHHDQVSRRSCIENDFDKSLSDSDVGPIDLCFLSGSRLTEDFVECPICCARFSITVRLQGVESFCCMSMVIDDAAFFFLYL